MAEPKKLEKYKVFPYIAWATVIGFALLVLNITMELRAAASDLRQSTSNLESAMQHNILDQDIDSLKRKKSDPQ